MSKEYYANLGMASVVTGGVTGLLLHHFRRNNMASSNKVPAGSEFVSDPSKDKKLDKKIERAKDEEPSGESGDGDKTAEDPGTKIAGNVNNPGGLGAMAENSWEAAKDVGSKVIGSVASRLADLIGKGLGWAAEKSVKVPATIGVAGLGAYGGYKAIDTIARKRESERAARSLERAKEIYMQSLPDMESGKMASDLTPVTDAMCLRLAMATETEPADRKTALDASEAILGGGVTIALAALLSGHLAAKRESDSARPKFRSPYDGVARTPYGVPDPVEVGFKPQPEDEETERQ